MIFCYRCSSSLLFFSLSLLPLPPLISRSFSADCPLPNIFFPFSFFLSLNSGRNGTLCSTQLRCCGHSLSLSLSLHAHFLPMKKVSYLETKVQSSTSFHKIFGHKHITANIKSDKRDKSSQCFQRLPALVFIGRPQPLKPISFLCHTVWHKYSMYFII